MTTTERINWLTARDFEIAGRGFVGMDRREWRYMRCLPVTGIWNRETRPGRQFFLQLESGDWQCWGTGVIERWESGPWHECVEPVAQAVTAEASAAEVSPLHPWISQLQQLGFRFISTINSVGNAWALFHGERVLVHTWCQKFTTRGFQTFGSVDELLAMQPVSTPSRLFVSMRDNPITMSGRTRQLALFGPRED